MADPQQPPVQQNVYINMAQRKGVNHLLHLILTICTGGAWGLVWLTIVIIEAVR